MSAPAYTTKRFPTMDVLRGIAILGILLANISAFSSPSTAITARDVSLGPGTELFLALRDLFVSGKMRSMLAMLFGAGLYLQYAQAMAKYEASFQSWPYRREGPPGWATWPGPYWRRTLWLAVLGAIHGIFIWYGDILFVYSLTAFITCLFAHKLKDKVILWIASSVLAVYGLGSLALTALMAFSPQSNTPAKFGVPLLDRFMSAAGETAIYQSASYLDQFLHRLVLFTLNQFLLVFILPASISLFLIGAMLARRGVFADPQAHMGDIKKLLAVGLGLGIPLNALPLVFMLAGSKIELVIFTETFSAPILALGVLAIILLAAQKLGPLTGVFQSVGKVALSCYLMQSLLATTIFYGWGFGQYGRLEWPGLLAVVAGIWVVNVVFAVAWTKKFSIGPVEWAWRSLAAGRAQPWVSRAPAPAPQPAGGPPPVMGPPDAP